MIRMILAAAVAFALVSASPVLACPNCNDCPNHKDKVAANEKAEKKDGEKKCACGAKDPKDCKCGGKCGCHAAKSEKKDDGKKS